MNLTHNAGTFLKQMMNKDRILEHFIVCKMRRHKWKEPEEYFKSLRVSKKQSTVALLCDGIMKIFLNFISFFGIYLYILEMYYRNDPWKHSLYIF